MNAPRTVLVVEDERVVARQLQLSLSDLGYHVPATAATTQQALDLASIHRPDLVLMDIRIKGEIDGIEAAAMLRERFGVPVVFLTAHGDPATFERAMVAEPYGYLIKPVDGDKLRTTVEVALHKHDLDERLRLSEAKFAGIIAMSADAIIAADEDQKIIVFNEGAEQIFGYTKDEALGAPLEMLVPDDTRQVHRRHVCEFAAGPVTSRRMEHEGAIRGRRKDGSEFPADATISKVAVGGKRLFAVVLRDVSERVRIEREQRFLAEAGAVLAASLDYRETCASVAELAVRELAECCVVDLVEDGGQVRRMAFASRDPTRLTVCDLLERTALERGRAHLVWSVLDSRQPIVLGDVRSAGGDAAGGDENLRLLRAVAARSAMLVPLMVHDRVLGVLAMVWSTPGRTYGPDDLRLAQQLADRAALAIENARLYDAARRAIRARDEVLGVVAHDLRNPLNTIMLQSRLLRGGGAETEGRTQTAMDRVDRAAARMNRLIEDLVDLTAIDAGQLHVEPERVDPAELVREAMEAHGPLASSSSVGLDVRLAPDLPEVRGDRQRLLQVFANLVGNAVKFTPAGGRITVAAAPGHQAVLFSVTDTGPGIPTDQIDQIFQRFWQGGHGHHRGAGLGLHIARGIVEAHGGRIWVDSAPGRGSTFYFAIPALAAAQAGVTRPDARPRRRRSRPGSGPGGNRSPARPRPARPGRR